MKNIKNFIFFLIFSLAIAFMYLGIDEIMNIKDISYYQDEGVHEFYPVLSYPTQETYYRRKVKKTRTVYYVEYHNTNGYKYTYRADNKAESDSIIKENKTIERSVFTIPTNGKHIAVEPYITPSQYVHEKRMTAYFLIGTSSIVLSGYVVYFIYQQKRQKKLQ